MVDKTCSDRILDIQEYLDRKRDYEKKGMSYINPELSEHLAGCLRCTREAAKQQETLALLDGLEQYEPPLDFTAGVMQRLSQPQGFKLPGWGLLLGAIVLSLAAAMLFILLYSAAAVFERLTLFENMTQNIVIGIVKVFFNLVDFIKEYNGILLSLLKGIITLVGAYPLAFGAAAAVTLALMVLLAREIGFTQQKLISAMK